MLVYHSVFEYIVVINVKNVYKNVYYTVKNKDTAAYNIKSGKIVKIYNKFTKNDENVLPATDKNLNGYRINEPFDNQFAMRVYYTEKLAFYCNLMKYVHQYKYTGELHGYNDDGSLMITAVYRDGKKNGPYIEYVKDFIVVNATYVDDLLHGLYEYNGGNGRSISRYCKGELEGIERKWDYAGILIHQCSYKNGMLDGVYKEYHKKRKHVVKNYNYVNGMKHGLCQEWSPFNKIKSQIEYVNGKTNGDHKVFDSNGILKKHTLRKNGRTI